MDELNMEIQLDGKKKKRFWELDFLRGICVILMVFDHTLCTMGFVMPAFSDKAYLFWNGISNWVEDVYWFGELRLYTRLVVLFFFFSICGICCTLSKNNMRRGFICFMVGCGITFVTVLVDIIADLGISIYFGVLHMLGISMIVYGLLDKLGSLIKKIGKSDKAKKATDIIGDYLAPTVGLILLIVYFTCFGHFEKGIIIGNFAIEDRSISVFASLFFEPQYEELEYIVGGSDYWPLLPYLAVVLLGGFAGRAVYCNDKAKNYLSKLDGKWNTPVCFVGRHAIIVYVLHQVVVFAVLALITLIAA